MRKVSNWNLPNVLTAVRILFVPVLAWLILHGDGHKTSWQWWSFVLFAVLMATDKLDGDIARKRGLVTDFGKVADPIADKALMITSFVCLNIVGVVSWWFTIIIVVRELGITAWRIVLLRRGRVVPASRGGKLKTTLQSGAVALYLMPLPGWTDPVRFGLLLVATIVTVVTGVQYILDGKRIQK